MKIFCNEGLLTALASRGCFTKEGRLNYRKDTKKSYKERWFKLRANLLFYYKTNDFGIVCEDEPRGCLILAHYTIKEELVANTRFAFSITFHGSNEKHYFVGQNADHCKGWIDTLQKADIDILRQQVINLRIQLRKMDPLLNASKEVIFPTFKKSNRLLTNIPKRLEKKNATGEGKKKKDIIQTTTEWHIPKAKSSSALEQVRKSYSLASLMPNPSKCKVKHDLLANKSTFFVNPDNFFSNIEYLDSSSHSFDTCGSSKSPITNSIAASNTVHISSNPPITDRCEKKEGNLSESEILRNKETQCRDSAAHRFCLHSSGEFSILREHQSQHYGIVLKPLTLASDPFMSSFSKPSGVSTKRDCCFTKQESEDLMTSKDAMPSGIDIIYRRPRSCTLAQLESIPSHLLGNSLGKEVVFSIGDDGLDSESNSFSARGNSANANANNLTRKDCTGFRNWETFEE